MKTKSVKILSFVLVLLLVLTALPFSVMADSFVVAGEKFDYELNEEGTYTITGYDGEDEVLQIPAYIDDIAVTELSPHSLYNDIEGYKLIIPETIKKIGGNALTCSNLTEIEVHPDNEFFCDVDGVLFDKDVTTLIYYPEDRVELSYTVPSTVTEIGAYGFHYGGQLEKITLPEGLKVLGERAFYFVDTLKEINMPETLESIGSGAFIGCSELIAVRVPDSVTELGWGAFDSCTNLQSIYFGSGIQSVNNELLTGCSSLMNITVAEDSQVFSVEDGVLFNKDKTELIKYPSAKADKNYTVPATVKTIKTEAFSHVTQLENITIPEGVETLEESAFWSCDELRFVKIPDSVTSMGYGFSNCKKLERVFIGKNANVIDMHSTFADCDSLIAIDVDEENPYCASVDGVLYNKDVTKIIKFPKGLDMKSYKLPLTVKEVYYPAFADQEDYYDEFYENLEIYVDDCLLEYDYQDKGNIVVKTGTRVIGSHAFWAESQIWGISLPEEIRYIGSMAFSCMDMLQAIYIPAGVKYIGTDAFWVSDICYDIYYGGSESQWKSIENIENAEIPEYATIHFNSEGNEFVNPVFPEDEYDYEYSNPELGISVFTDTDAQLNADNITSEELVASVDELLPKATVEAVYEINLSRDGEEIQPEDRVVVKIPTNNRFARVYRMEEDGTLTDMNAEYRGGYLVFYTDHFSLYTLAQKVASLYECGDVNMDENVNIKDATAVQKYTASLIELEDGVLSFLADFDKNKEVNIKDATSIQKFIAGLI
ncbi:MAG: leucine-rich repeat protein [Ruminococcus sp.]|nr:leucine-rich repeat protein [Ruminococcus sp.]